MQNINSTYMHLLNQYFQSCPHSIDSFLFCRIVRIACGKTANYMIGCMNETGIFYYSSKVKFMFLNSSLKSYAEIRSWICLPYPNNNKNKILQVFG